MGALLVLNARPWPAKRFADADAVLVVDGRIAAVGHAEVLAGQAPGARRLDARGATVTPGLIDAHVHFVPWARSRRQPDLHGATTRAAAVARVAAALAADPGEAPLVGRGWDASGWEAPPHREALDALAPARPVLLHSHDFHAVWTNSAALRAAGITRATPDTPGGCLEREEREEREGREGRAEREPSGEPTGVARENAVRAFVPLEERAGPRVDEALLDEAADTLLASGVTAVHDFQRNDADFRHLRALAGRRRLRVLQHFGPEQMEALAAAGHASGEGDAWFRLGALKLFADGTLGSRTAALLEPWEDRDGTGMEVMSRQELIALARRAAGLRMAVAIHAVGDRGVRNALDALEAGIAAAGGAARPRPLPPRIEHIQLLGDADRPRFAALGVVASMQPQHCVTDIEAAVAGWGARVERSYPWRALLAGGAALAFGSDAPVEPPAPWIGLHAALTRRHPDGSPEGGFVPAQCLGLDEALHAYTAGAAAVAGLTGVLGTLDPGAEADLVVWDRDLSSAPPAGILAARPAATVLAGEIVYSSPLNAAVTDRPAGLPGGPPSR